MACEFVVLLGFLAGKKYISRSAMQKGSATGYSVNVVRFCKFMEKHSSKFHICKIVGYGFV